MNQPAVENADSPFSAEEPNHSGAASREKQDAPQPSEATVDNLKPWLRDVPLKIRRPGILSEEYQTYYRVLDFARSTPAEEVRRAAREFLAERRKQSQKKDVPMNRFPVYVDQYLHPEAYQGRPVIMSGHVQRVVKTSAGENEYGIDTLYELWLFTDDSQQNPTVVVSAELPEGFPIGEQAVDHVTVTGYYYRLYTYRARDQGRFAPLLMASSIQWKRPGKGAENDHSLLIIVVLLFVLFGVSLFIAVLMHQRWQLKQEQMRFAREDPSSPFGP